MNNVQDMILEFNSILDFVKECAKSGLEEFIELEERLSLFGENLNAFLFNSLEEIENLKKKLNEQKLESKEIIAQLNQKIKVLSGTMTDADYKLCSLVCKKDYEQCWDLLEEDSRKFLITAYFVMKAIKKTKFDFSAVVLCLCKPFENELKKKIYEPFIIRESKLPLIKNERSKLCEGIVYYQKNGVVYLPTKMMLVCLKPTSYTMSYQQRLHNELCSDCWNMAALTNQKFIDGSIDYMEEYRNMAAHTHVLEEKNANACKTETRKYVTYFLSAYPK